VLLSLHARPVAADETAEDAYRRAHACLASNRFSEAAALFRRAAASTNADTAAAARLGLGEALCGANLWTEAAAAYDALLARHPASALAPNALCGRGFAEARAGLLPQALATFTALAERYPDHPLATTAAASTGTLARTLAAQERLERTEKVARAVETLNALRRDGRHAEASSAAERFLHDHPDYPQAAELAVTAADSAVQAGEWARAETLARAFLANYPQHALAPRARRALGDALAARSRFAEAAQAYALSDAPDAALLSADCLYRAGRYEEALNRYEETARTAADPALAARTTLAIGDCHAALENWQAAERAYLRVEVLLDADAARPAALARLADLYDRMRQTNQAARARADLKRRYPDYSGEPRYSPFGFER